MSDTSIDKLIEDLKSSDDTVARNAARNLGKQTDLDTSLVESIVSELKNISESHSSAGVQYYAKVAVVNLKESHSYGLSESEDIFGVNKPEPVQETEVKAEPENTESAAKQTRAAGTELVDEVYEEPVLKIMDSSSGLESGMLKLTVGVRNCGKVDAHEVKIRVILPNSVIPVSSPMFGAGDVEPGKKVQVMWLMKRNPKFQLEFITVSVIPMCLNGKGNPGTFTIATGYSRAAEEAEKRRQEAEAKAKREEKSKKNG